MEGKALSSPRGDLEAGAQRVSEFGAQRVSDPGALRAAEHSRTEGSLSAESVLSATPWNALSQALIYSLTVYPPSTAPAAPHLSSPNVLYLSHCPLYLSDRPLPRTLSSFLHLPLYSGSVLAFRS